MEKQKYTINQLLKKSEELELVYDKQSDGKVRPVQFIRVRKDDEGKTKVESAEDSSALAVMMDRVAAMRAGQLALTRDEFEEFSAMSAPAQAAYSVKKLREQKALLAQIDAKAGNRKNRRIAKSRRAQKKARAITRRAKH